MKKIIAILATLFIALTAAPASGSTASDTFDADTVKYTNAERTNKNLAKFKGHSCIDKYAQQQADRQAKANKMYHQDLMTVLKACKARGVGENVAYGFTTGKSNVAAWMGSPGHRANILNAKFKYMGVGAAKASNGRWYTAQVFAYFG